MPSLSDELIAALASLGFTPGSLSDRYHDYLVDLVGHDGSIDDLRSEAGIDRPWELPDPSGSPVLSGWGSTGYDVYTFSTGTDGTPWIECGIQFRIESGSYQLVGARYHNVNDVAGITGADFKFYGENDISIPSSAVTETWGADTQEALLGTPIALTPGVVYTVSGRFRGLPGNYFYSAGILSPLPKDFADTSDAVFSAVTPTDNPYLFNINDSASGFSGGIYPIDVLIQEVV